MSQEAVAAFFEQIQADPALQSQLKSVTDAQLPARMVATAREHGHDFSEADVREMMEAPAESELPDEALESVAGGFSLSFEPSDGLTNIGLNATFCSSGKHIGTDDPATMIRKAGGDSP